MVLEAVIEYKLIIPATTKSKFVVIHFGGLTLQLPSQKAQWGELSHSSGKLFLY